MRFIKEIRQDDTVGTFKQVKINQDTIESFAKALISEAQVACPNAKMIILDLVADCVVLESIDVEKEGGEMITRYRPDVDEEERSAPMHEDKEGDYVAYEEYEDEVNALKAENERLKEDLNRLLKEMYRSDRP